MKKILSCLIATLLSLSALAEHHNSAEAEVIEMAEAFNTAYATNDIEAYFDMYADDAEVFFYGARQDMGAYHEEWSAMAEAGGGVEMNEMSDLKIQVMPCGDVAIATSFVDNRTRSPDGEVTTVKAFETDVWQKIDGEWKVINLHYSEIASD